MNSIKIGFIALVSCSVLHIPVAMAEGNDGFNEEEITKLKERCHQKPDDPACKVVEKMLEHVKKRCEKQPENPLCAKFLGEPKPEPTPAK